MHAPGRAGATEGPYGSTFGISHIICDERVCACVRAAFSQLEVVVKLFEFHFMCIYLTFEQMRMLIGHLKALV